jgi:lipoate-protein ligase A
MICIEPQSTDAAFHFSVEEYCMTRFDASETIWMFWRADGFAMLGRNQIAEAEIDAREAERLGVRTVRRSSGGGAIFTDMGTLLFTVILPLGRDGDAKRLLLQNAAEPIARALREMGADAGVEGRNDITAAGKKVSGMAQYIMNGRLCSHGSLLFDADLESLAAVLRADPEKFQTKALRSVRARVANLAECPSLPRDIKTFWRELKKRLFASFPVREYALTERDAESVGKIRAEKYANPEWTFGKTPKFSFENRKRFPGGKVEIALETEKNAIRRCRINGDFLALRPVRELEERIEGAPFAFDAVKRRISGADLRMYLGTVTQEEFLSCVFDRAVPQGRQSAAPCPAGHKFVPSGGGTPS